MKALVYYGPNNVLLSEMNEPKLGPSEVCVKVKAVSICGSDLKGFKGKSSFRVPPLIMGHEFSGVITEISPDVTHLHIGQRVAVNPNLYCGECRNCKSGSTNLCTNRKNVGTTMAAGPYNGGMAEYVCVPATAVLPIPETVSYEEAALLEPLAVSLHAVKSVANIKGATIAVIGVGPIGLLAIECAKILGAKNIIALGTRENRLKKAEECGANVVLNNKQDIRLEIKEITEGLGVDIAIDAVGTSESINQCIEIVKNSGEVNVIGLAANTVEINVSELVCREIRLNGSYIYTNEMAEGLNLVVNGDLNLKKLITTETSLENGPDVFNKLAAGASNDIKVVLTL